MSPSGSLNRPMPSLLPSSTWWTASQVTIGRTHGVRQVSSVLAYLCLTTHFASLGRYDRTRVIYHYKNILSNHLFVKRYRVLIELLFVYQNREGKNKRIARKFRGACGKSKHQDVKRKGRNGCQQEKKNRGKTGETRANSVDGTAGMANSIPR